MKIRRYKFNKHLPFSNPAEKETAPEAATTEEDGDGKGSKRSPELTKLWKTVEANPADFTGWTYLLQVFTLPYILIFSR